MSQYNNRKHLRPSLTKIERQLLTGVERAIEDSEAALREMSRMPGAQLSLSICQSCGGAGAVDPAESRSTTRAEAVAQEQRLTDALDRNDILIRDLKAKQTHCEDHHPQGPLTELGLELRRDVQTEKIDFLQKRVQYGKRAATTGVGMSVGSLVMSFAMGPISENLFAGIAPALILTIIVGMFVCSWGNFALNKARPALEEAQVARIHTQILLAKRRGVTDSNPWRDMMDAPVTGIVIEAVDATGRIAAVSFRFVNTGPRVTTDWYPVDDDEVFTPVLWRTRRYSPVPKENES